MLTNYVYVKLTERYPKINYLLFLLRKFSTHAQIKIMNQNLRLLMFVACVMLISMSAFAQEKKPVINVFTKKGKGVGFVTADSTFSLNFQFRMQNRAAFVSKTGTDLSPNSFEMRVRRTRFKFEGFVYNPKLTYYIQLAFSRGDMDFSVTDNSAINNSPNIIRDAVIYYSPTKHLRFGFGQTKLPGNRQRVISSGDQQFADRSIVNATFNIDRDFGFFANYAGNFYNLRGAITSGEGRNSNGSNNGLAWTGRLELLPLGKFTGTNDYQEGDLEREPKPKISIGSTYSYNDRAMRQAGQLGNDLYEVRGIRNFEVDLLFKYNGWAWYNEYMTRSAADPITVSPTDASKTRIIYVGRGYLTQLSYLFKNNFEVAGRFSRTTPFSSIYASQQELEQSEFGVTKYLNGHRLKIQGNVVYGHRTHVDTKAYASDFWSGIFQIELGI
jgi:phosphate-selective porin OprO and OprP